jgi:uncharacterized Tic20 family protein
MPFGRAASRRNTAQAPMQARRWPGTPPTHGEVKVATATYFGTIVGPVAPLYVYLTWRRTAPFVTWHAVQALNLSLTCLLYGVCCAIVGGLLTLDKLSTALGVVLPVVVVGCAFATTHLVRAAMAASRGEYLEIPTWICSPFVKYDW